MVLRTITALLDLSSFELSKLNVLKECWVFCNFFRSVVECRGSYHYSLIILYLFTTLFTFSVINTLSMARKITA